MGCHVCSWLTYRLSQAHIDHIDRVAFLTLHHCGGELVTVDLGWPQVLEDLGPEPAPSRERVRDRPS